MNLEKLKQLALIDQMGGQPQAEQQQQESKNRTAIALMQSLMQQDAEAARNQEQTTYREGLLRQAQEGLDIKRDALTQQSTMSKTAATDKAAAAKLATEDKATAAKLLAEDKKTQIANAKAAQEAASKDRQLAILVQLGLGGNLDALRALGTTNEALGKATQDRANEATAMRRTGVNAKVKSLYDQNATNPTMLAKALSGMFANPETTGVPGATMEDLNMVPYGELDAGMKAASVAKSGNLVSGRLSPEFQAALEQKQKDDASQEAKLMEEAKMLGQQSSDEELRRKTLRYLKTMPSYQVTPKF